MRQSRRAPLIVMIAGLAVCTLTRIYSIAACTDMNTGFFYHDSELPCNILYYGMIAATGAAAMIAAHFDEKGGLGKAEAADIVDGSAIVIGFGLLALAFCAFYEGLTETKAVKPSSLLINADFIFAVGAAITAFVILYRKEFKPLLGAVLSLGGAYYVMRGINYFRIRMVIASVPEYLIQVLGTVGAAMTFVMLGRFLSGNSGKYTVKWLCGWGSATAALSLSSAAATALSKLLAPEETARRITPSAREAVLFFQSRCGEDGYMLAFTPLFDVVTGAFAAAAVIAVLYAKRRGTAEE